MADIEIVCVKRDTTKNNRIVMVGIRPLGKTRTHRLISVEEAIARCNGLRKGTRDKLFVEYKDKHVAVEVVDGPTRFYLRSLLNNTVEDNLHHLKECSGTTDPILTGNSIDDFLQGKI